MVPVIGIVSCGFIEEKQFVSQPYIHAIENSGGLPIIIPCTRAVPRHPSLQFCDAFLFCGGDDITPLLMGEDPSPENGTTDLKTDFFHLKLMKTVLASGRPVLAICRGMQILNIAMGGSIYQDASLYPKVHISHIQHSKKRSDISHKVFFQKPSILYNIYGEYAFTNSFHHQYIWRQTAIPSLSVFNGIRNACMILLPVPAGFLTVLSIQHPKCRTKDCNHR